MTITIKGREIELKYSIRALLIFENITGESFKGDTLEQMVTLFYSIVLSSTKDFTINFDEFLDEIDNNPELLKQYTEWLLDMNKVQDLIKKK